MSLFYLLPVAVILHIIEEFLFPGGFTKWYKNYLPSLASSFTAGYLIKVNIILIVFSLLPIFLSPIPAVALWLIVAAILFINALFHIKGLIKLKKYSPGVITSIFLYIPLSIFGYWYFISNKMVSNDQVLVSLSTGIAYWIFSEFNHRRRAKKTVTE